MRLLNDNKTMKAEVEATAISADLFATCALEEPTAVAASYHSE